MSTRADMLAALDELTSKIAELRSRVADSTDDAALVGITLELDTATVETMAATARVELAVLAADPSDPLH